MSGDPRNGLPGPGGEQRVAAAVAEHPIVGELSQRRLRGDRRAFGDGGVAHPPVHVVDVVDGVEPAREQVIGQDAAQVRRELVLEYPVAIRRPVVVDARLYASPQPAHVLLYERDHEVLTGAHDLAGEAPGRELLPELVGDVQRLGLEEPPIEGGLGGADDPLELFVHPRHPRRTASRGWRILIHGNREQGAGCASHEHVEDDAERRPRLDLVTIARHEPVERQIERQEVRLAVEPLGNLQRAVAMDGIAPGIAALFLERRRGEGRARIRGIAAELLVAIEHRRERVVVEPEQHVIAVLEAAVEILASAAAGGLSAQPPAHLVDRDVQLVLPARLAGQPVHSRERSHPAAQYRQLSFRDPLIILHGFEPFSLQSVFVFSLGYGLRAAGYRACKNSAGACSL